MNSNTTLRIPPYAFAVFVLLLGLLLTSCGGSAEPEVPPTPTLSAEQTAGKAVFQGAGACSTCHSLKADVRIVGPSLHGINDVAGSRVEGQSAEEYLLASIIRPQAYIVEGYEDVAMDPTIASRLTLEEIDQVVAYLQTID